MRRNLTISKTIPQLQHPRTPIFAHTPHRSITITTQRQHTQPLNMSSDTSYATFLHKANSDPNSGSQPSQPKTSTSQSRSHYDPSITNPSASSPTAIPESLLSLPSTPYVSDTDSDWEPVFLNYSGDTLPSLADFKQVLQASGENGEVEELDIKDFDPRGEYKEIVERVAKAGEGEKGVKVFRVQKGVTRVVYFVLTVGERKLVGVKANAVES